jgi:dipeptidyl aminopeptidase/acylaminoacyl peptidase
MNALKDTVYTRASGDWSPVLTFDVTTGGESKASVVGEMYDSPSLAVAKYGDSDTMSLVRVDLSGKGETRLFHDPSYDLDSILHDEWTGKVIGARYIADRPVDVYFDPSLEALQKGLDAAFPGNNVQILSHDRSSTKFIVAVEGPRQPTAFVLYDRTTKGASVIANTYTKLMPADLGEVRPYSFTARDGLVVRGYLTLPPGVTDPKGLPTVVFPHGGPEARDSIGFDWIAQFLANRGYLVFQPNFRGSTGLGAKFHDAGDGQWGKGMINDIADGTKALITDGSTDRNHVCIVGASYGGYAALAEATFDPSLYKCAVSYAGVSNVDDLLSFENHRSDADVSLMANEARIMGGRLGDSALDAISPALHADQVTIPILLVHADHDTTVPIGQSNEEEAALKKAGKLVEYDRIPGDDHYLSTASSRIEFLKRTEAFLAKYLGH